MTIQFYPAEKDAKIFDSTGRWIVSLAYAPSTQRIDEVLRILGFRRREAWQGADWGFEARLRRR